MLSTKATGGESQVRIKLSDAGQVERLLAFLAFDSNVIVTQIALDEVEVSFLGSLNASAQVMQSELRLRMWLAAHPDVIAILQE
jgi:predicted N-acetyltransferase YhbS